MEWNRWDEVFVDQNPSSQIDPPIVRYLKRTQRIVTLIVLTLNLVKMSLNFSIVSVDSDMIQISQLYANRFLTLKLKKKAIWRLHWVVNSLFVKTYLSLSKSASTIPIIALLKVCTWIFWIWNHSISAKIVQWSQNSVKNPTSFDIEMSVEETISVTSNFGINSQKFENNSRNFEIGKTKITPDLDSRNCHYRILGKRTPHRPPGQL